MTVDEIIQSVSESYGVDLTSAVGRRCRGGENLTNARLAAVMELTASGLTQKETAAALGIARWSVWRYQNRFAQVPQQSIGHRARAILADVSRERMVGVRDIRGPLKIPYLVAARREAIARMRADDIPVAAIAAAINRGVSTVKHYLYPSIRRAKQAHYRATLTQEATA